MDSFNPEPPLGPTALEIIDVRLRDLNSDVEIKAWLALRKDVLAQNRAALDDEHRRLFEKREARVKLAHSIVAIPVALVLLWHGGPFYPGTNTPGLALLGAGFYSLALNIFKSFAREK
jgi:hypothetical protein